MESPIRTFCESRKEKYGRLRRLLKLGKLEDLQKFKNEIEEMYNDNITLKDIAEQFKCSRDTISRFLKKNNIQERKKINLLYKNFSEEDDLKIKELYETGKSTREIGKIMDTSGVTISKHLQKMGIEIRDLHNSRQEYTFNEDYFETIDNEHKAYWLGFIAADGCVLEPTTCISKRTGKEITKGNGALEIALQKSDINHLKKFQQDISDTHKIYFRKQQEACSLKLHSSKMYEDLIKTGIIPRKSKKLKFPQTISEELFPHFLRGYFDGDGSISFSKTKKGTIMLYSIAVSFIGNEEFITQVSNKLKKYNIKGNFSYKRGIENIKTFSLTNIETKKRFLDFIYKNATIYLDRKYYRYLIFNKLYDDYILQQYKKGKI